MIEFACKLSLIVYVEFCQLNQNHFMVGKLSQQEIEAILKDNTWGHLGCNDGFNTYVYPVNFYYDGKFIMCHSQVGAKIKIMRQNSRICLQVDEVISHTNWKSVMVLGYFQEIQDQQERYNAMKAFEDRQMRIKRTDNYAVVDKEKENESTRSTKNLRPVIYRILIDEKTGQYEAE